MRSATITVIILLSSVGEVHAQDSVESELVDKLTDKLIERSANQAHNVDLDKMVLGKPGSLSTPQLRVNTLPRSALPVHHTVGSFMAPNPASLNRAPMASSPGGTLSAYPLRKQQERHQPLPASSVKSEAPVEEGVNIRITLEAQNAQLIDQSAQEIIDTAREKGAGIMGPVPLPKHIRKYTLLRSPHVDKKSREQFEMRTHKRLLGIKAVHSEVVDGLMRLQLPAGVNVKIELEGSK
jgi:small subunit ribosomal protein S10